MKNSINTFLFLTIVILLVGCDGSKKSAINKNNEEEVLNFDFFPSDAGTQVGDALTVDSSAFYNTTKVLLERKNSIEEVNKLKNSK